MSGEGGKGGRGEGGKGEGGRGRGEAKLHVKDLMEQHSMLFALYLLGTGISSVDEAWLVKVLGILHLSIT